MAKRQQAVTTSTNQVINDKNNSPDYESKAWQFMSDAWRRVYACYAGTLFMRANAGEFIPKYPLEAEDEWSYRVKQTTFHNVFLRTLDALVGLVFRKEPEFENDVPEIIKGDEEKGIEGLAENIDNRGTGFAVFLKEVFKFAMRDGHAFIFVDAPPLPVRADGQKASRSDLESVGWRPYWTMYEASQAINWLPESVNGRETLAQITFRLNTIKQAGRFGEEEVITYRVYTKNSYETWEETRDQNGKKTLRLVPELSGVNSLGFIPLCPVYTNKTGFLTSAPRLLDLAEANISHMNKDSDYGIYLHICAKPILWFRGRDTSKPVQAVGPFVYYDVEAMNGQVSFAEPAGGGLQACAENLKTIERRMAMLGISIMSEQGQDGSTKTATEIDSFNQKEGGDLQTAATNCKDAAELALMYTMILLTGDFNAKGGGLRLAAQLEPAQVSIEQKRFLRDLFNDGMLDKETFLMLLHSFGDLPENVSVQDVLNRLANQLPDVTQ